MKMKDVETALPVTIALVAPNISRYSLALVEVTVQSRLEYHWNVPKAHTMMSFLANP
jgi:hypothetical protein